MADIAFKTSNNIVLGDNATFNGAGKLMLGNGYVARFDDQNTTIVLGAAALPGDFVLGKYLWINSAYVVNPEHIPYAPPPPVAVVLDGAEWREYAYRQLGAILAPAGDDAQKDAAGLTRYGGILKDGRASTDDTVIAAFDQYDDASRFRQDKVTIFLTVLLIAGILTQAEFDAIINNWPEM